jgi:hypothetical protein
MNHHLMKLPVAFLLIACGCLCGCEQPAVTNASFFHEASIATPQGGTANHLVLQLGRHADELLSGPDIDEDQLLVLDIRDFRLNQKLAIPSANVSPRLSINRFGPPSQGKEFHGFLVVKSLSTNLVTVVLDLNAVAETDDNSYSEKTRFKGQFKFFPEQAEDDDQLFQKHPLTP